MGKTVDPFRTVLWQASDRLFAHRLDLTPELDADPQHTLYRLSTVPDQFAPLLPALNPARRQIALNRVLTAARAYVVNRRKPVADAVHQTTLPLPAASPTPSPHN